MNTNWEKNVRRVVPYTPGEQPKETDVIKLNTNENPYPPAPAVRKILDEFDVSRMRLYPAPDADVLGECHCRDLLRETLAGIRGSRF